jgi:hypothetical protein
MSQFKRESVTSFPDDKGISVKKLVSLIKGTKYESEIMDSLSVAQYEKDIVVIPGAATLLKKIEAAKEKYTKLDILSDFSNVTFTPDLNNSQRRNESVFQVSFDSLKDVGITYPNPDDVSDEVKLLIEGGKEGILAEPAYDAQTQMFSRLFNMEKYANTLLERNSSANNELLDLIDLNLKQLKAYYSSPSRKFSHRYRLLRQNDNGKYFFRAIISPTVYKDYNVGVSAFIALMTMHQVMKRDSDNYIIKSFSHTESLINVYFENIKGRKIDGLGEVRFQVLLSNSEITSGAVKLSGLFSILVKIDGKLFAIDAKKTDDDSRFKDTIVSISHGSGPERAIKEMAASNKLKAVENQLYDEVRRINTTRDPQVLKNIFVNRLNNSRSFVTDESSRAELTKVFNEQANTFLDLLKIMGRAQAIVENEGVEAKDYLRFVVYSVLAGTGNGPANNKNNEAKTDE